MYQATCQLSAKLSAVTGAHVNSKADLSSKLVYLACYALTWNVWVEQNYMSKVEYIYLTFKSPSLRINIFFTLLTDHVGISLSSQIWGKQQHAWLLGNNWAGWGPRLPWTTIVCIISQLWGWLELRSFPFMSAEPPLLLRTLAPLVTSCHHQ